MAGGRWSRPPGDYEPPGGKARPLNRPGTGRHMIPESLGNHALPLPPQAVGHPSSWRPIMPTTIPAASIAALDRRITLALTHRDHRALDGLTAVASWLASVAPSEPSTRQLAARAEAAGRFLAGWRHHG